MYPTLDDQVFIKMREEIEKARMSQDSVGGIIECAIAHVPAGIGNPFFDSVESHLSPLLFSIPAVKSVSFGSESIHQMYGHEANDAYYYQGDQVKTKTNHNGVSLEVLRMECRLFFKLVLNQHLLFLKFKKQLMFRHIPIHKFK